MMARLTRIMIYAFALLLAASVALFLAMDVFGAPIAAGQVAAPLVGAFLLWLVMACVDLVSLWWAGRRASLWRRP